MSLHDALGGMRTLKQWFLWRLTWDAEEGKYQKKPMCGDASLPQNWMTYDDAVDTLDTIERGKAALGFWMQESNGYWFLDVDKALVDGQWSALSQQLVASFPGALVEASSSGKGLHVIGRSKGLVPPHSSRGKQGLEFYTGQRGIAFGLSGEAHGSADTEHDEAVRALVAERFPPIERKESVGPDPRWRGPADDDALIVKMMGARQSAEAAFGGKPSFAQLWRGEAERNSENDMALMSHLAFWTGNDWERMVRLAKRSGMVRDKWTSHRTYLADTARKAANSENVYVERVAEVIQLPTSDMMAVVLELARGIGGAMTADALMNEWIPKCRDANIPNELLDFVCRPLSERLKLFGGTIPKPHLRLMIAGKPARAELGEAPEWCHQHCYITRSDKFRNVITGEELTRVGFDARFSRLMPGEKTGKRASAAEACLQQWGMVTVADSSYRPDQPMYFSYMGKDHVNLFSPSSLPEVPTAYSLEGQQVCHAIWKHVMEMCGGRDWIARKLMQWIAHNARYPGTKIRWSPLIQGVQGDGKSFLGVVIRAALGARNVKITSVSSLMNSGGFTDWAVGYAVNIIEEIHVERRNDQKGVYNAMKSFISDDFININAKGRVSNDPIINVTNHMANTNYMDALPIEAGDRRWMFVSAPWHNANEAAKVKGLASAAELAKHIGALADAVRNHAGEVRKWLVEDFDLSDFDPNERALETEDKVNAIAASNDDGFSEFVMEVIKMGGHLVSEEEFSSRHLWKLVQMLGNFEISEMPKTTAWAKIIRNLGYVDSTPPVRRIGRELVRMKTRNNS